MKTEVEVWGMHDDSREQFALPADEFFLLMAANHKAKEMPPFLDIKPAGRSPAERAELTAAASEALAARGLGTIDDPAPDLLELTHQLATASTRIEFGVMGDDEASLSVAAVQGSHAAVATRERAEVRLWKEASSSLLRTLLETVSPLEAGKGTTSSIPVADFERARQAHAADDSWALRDTLRNAKVAHTPTVTRAVEGGPGGMLAATWRVDEDEWESAPVGLSWVDSSMGRFVIRADNEWVTVTPADDARLASMAGDIVQQVEVAAAQHIQPVSEWPRLSRRRRSVTTEPSDAIGRRRSR